MSRSRKSSKKNIAAAAYGTAKQPQENWMSVALAKANSEAFVHDPEHVQLPYPGLLLLLRETNDSCARCHGPFVASSTGDPHDVPMIVSPVIPYDKGGCNCLTNLQPLCVECAEKTDGEGVDYLAAQRHDIGIRADELTKAMIAIRMGHEEHLAI